jgi:peptide/nickel transport system permease protein
VIRYLAVRIVSFALTLVGVVVLVAALLRLVPGDPAAVFLGENATPSAVAELRHTLGLDAPFPVQLARYFGGVARGDLGESLFQREPVSKLIAGRLPATLELAFAALVVGITLGGVLGVASAFRRGTLVDIAVLLFAQIGVSMPVFWLGILLTALFSLHWNLLPAVGRGSLQHLILPALTLGAGLAAIASRLVRTSLLDVLEEPYVRGARARGLPDGKVIAHAMANALLPVISVLAVRFGSLLGGSVLTESVFGWPGLGTLAVSAISQRDFPLVQGIVLTFAALFLALNLGVDLAYGYLDPRVRIGAER